ncbi:tonB-system energizer ExbB [uncultured Alsobacter sp.]|uniref:tonB-system energizer ExbB n=1 Tax=uncultured Alsobacter sp. TaxID=1748258 RepID=UPI0025F0409C|nr:tonB-system energizer ExbB [uncultured Alsobacter sp.]
MPHSPCRLRAVALGLLAFASAPLSPALAATAAPGGTDLSPWSMFMGADIVVKAIMVGLAAASVLTWTIVLAKSVEIGRARRRLAADLANLSAQRSLAGAAQARRPGSAVGSLVDGAVEELRLSPPGADRGATQERVASRLRRGEAALARRLGRGIAPLATIGSIGPFVGLLGTVWGIMNSFVGIAKTQTTSLAVVAPGIAEALLATAIGLVAAIPAVVAYNHFGRSIAAYRALLGDAAATVERIVSRDLERSVRTGPVALAAE